MQHIPVVSHVLLRGGLFSFLKMMDVVPTIQTTDSYHRQDLCVIYLQQGGKSLHGDRGVEREVE